MPLVADDIIEGLADLPQEKLRDVMQRASFLLDPSGRGTSAPTDEEKITADQRLVLSELETILAGRSNFRQRIPLKVLQKVGKGVFARGVENLMGLIRADFGNIKRVETVKVIRVLLGCMATDVARKGGPLGLQAMCHAMVNVTYHVDKNFPGYRRAGLLRFVVGRATE